MLKTDWGFYLVTEMLFVAQGDFISFTRATFDIYFTYYMPTCYLWHFKYGQPLLAKNRKSVFGTTPVHINHWNHLLQFPHRLQTWRSSSLWCGANLNAAAEMRVAQFYVAALCFSVWGGTTQSIQRVKFLRLIIICPEAVQKQSRPVRRGEINEEIDFFSSGLMVAAVP